MSSKFPLKTVTSLLSEPWLNITHTFKGKIQHASRKRSYWVQKELYQLPLMLVSICTCEPPLHIELFRKCLKNVAIISIYSQSAGLAIRVFTKLVQFFCPASMVKSQGFWVVIPSVVPTPAPAPAPHLVVWNSVASQAPGLTPRSGPRGQCFSISPGNYPTPQETASA